MSSMFADGKYKDVAFRVCMHCEQSVELRNPTGYCDHLYYPEKCLICRTRLKRGMSLYK